MIWDLVCLQRSLVSSQSVCKPYGLSEVLRGMQHPDLWMVAMARWMGILTCPSALRVAANTTGQTEGDTP